jgi:hypothetical protein
MKKIKLNNKIILALIALFISSNVWSLQQTEPKAINKKDIVDEIDRSAIEENESSEVPQIDNMMPAFKMPDFKANVKDSNTTVRRSQVQKPKNKPNKKQNVVVKKSNTEIEKKSEKTVAGTKPKINAEIVKAQEKQKPIVFIKKSLKPKLIFKNDVFILENGKTTVQRTSKKYIYKYRYKSVLPLNSKGLKPIKTNHYLVVDKLQLIADINNSIKTDKAKDSNQNVVDEGLSDEIKLKRITLAKKYNRGKTINFSITKSRLKSDDIIYDFGDIQMVTRKKLGPSSAKKFWLYPTIDLKSPVLMKTGNGKYKVLKKL